MRHKYNNSNDSKLIKLYGVGISFVEAIALPRTLQRILDHTDAVLVAAPHDEYDYYCYVYYMDKEDWEDGYAVLMHNFAITSDKMYVIEMNEADLFE